MRGTTHSCIGLTTALLVLRPEPSHIVLCSSYAILGSLVPDIDIKYGTIRKPTTLLFLAGLFSYQILTFNHKVMVTIGIIIFLIMLGKASTKPHRTTTHSLLSLIFFCIPLTLISIKVTVYFFIGYFMHLYADSFTKSGVPFLFPFDKNKYGLKLMKTGSSTESVITLITLLIFLKFLSAKYTSSQLSQVIILFISPIINFIKSNIINL